MGSKRKSCYHIANIIEAHSKLSDKVFLDLFCGGFAVWEVFLKKWYKVIANDKNKYVIALLEKTINGKLDEKKCLQWVSREQFIHVLQHKDKYEDWYVWYVMCVWSFWNNQKYYLFSPEIERQKYSLYELVVNSKIDDFILKNFPRKYIEGILKQKDWHTRRMALKKVMTVMKDRNDLESLESLERLQSLERLERLGNVEFLSKNYDEVIIPEWAIVYCDPPYQWTAEYAIWWFYHHNFWEYMRKISKKNKVFISEYNAPEDFKCIFEFSQKSSLAWWSQSHNNQPKEKLFTI